MSTADREFTEPMASHELIGEAPTDEQESMAKMQGIPVLGVMVAAWSCISAALLLTARLS
jgi:hypothetical protein